MRTAYQRWRLIEILLLVFIIVVAGVIFTIGWVVPTVGVLSELVALGAFGVLFAVYRRKLAAIRRARAAGTCPSCTADMVRMPCPACGWQSRMHKRRQRLRAERAQMVEVAATMPPIGVLRRRYQRWRWTVEAAIIVFVIGLVLLVISSLCIPFIQLLILPLLIISIIVAAPGCLRMSRIEAMMLVDGHCLFCEAPLTNDRCEPCDWPGIAE